ncbi:MAG: hypothetical protein MJ100_06825 [Ruminococcus sp.]|nr:hypothetical protein [Ruminococcus sp.]
MKTDASHHFTRRILSAVISAVTALTYGVPNSFPINTAKAAEQIQYCNTVKNLLSNDKKDECQLFAIESITCPENIRAKIISPVFIPVRTNDDRNISNIDTAENTENIGMSSSQNHITYAGSDIGYASAEIQFRALSDELSKLANSYASLDISGITLNAGSQNVLNITADENSASLKISDVSGKFSVNGTNSDNGKDQTFIVNIDLAGKPEVTFSPDLTFRAESIQNSNISPDAETYVLFNLFNAAKNGTTVKFINDNINGHILAPDCNISVKRISGNITANRIEVTDVSDMEIFGDPDKKLPDNTVKYSETADTWNDSGTVNHDADNAEETLSRSENKFAEKVNVIDEADTNNAISQNYNTANNFLDCNAPCSENGLSTAGSRNAPDQLSEPLARRIYTDAGDRNTDGAAVTPKGTNSGSYSDAYAERQISANVCGTIISGAAQKTDLSRNDALSESSTNTLHERYAPLIYPETRENALNVPCIEPYLSGGRMFVIPINNASSDTAPIFLSEGRKIFAHEAMNGLAKTDILVRCEDNSTSTYSQSAFPDNCEKYIILDTATESGIIRNISLTTEGDAPTLPDNTTISQNSPLSSLADISSAYPSENKASDLSESENSERKSYGIYEKDGYSIISENLNDIDTNDLTENTAYPTNYNNRNSADVTVKRSNELNFNTADNSAISTNPRNNNSAVATVKRSNELDISTADNSAISTNSRNNNSAVATVKRNNELDINTADNSAISTNSNSINSADVTVKRSNELPIDTAVDTAVPTNINIKIPTENTEKRNNGNDRNKAEIKVNSNNKNSKNSADITINIKDNHYSVSADQISKYSEKSADITNIQTNSDKNGQTINSISVTALNAASDIPTNEENTTENITTADSEITTAETTMTTATDTATNISDTETDTSETTATTTVKSNVKVIRRDDDDIPVTGVTLVLTGMDNEGNTIIFDNNIVKSGENVSVLVGDGREISWSTGTSPMELSLPDGYFFLHESDAPEGHKSPDDVMIVVSEGEMISVNGETPDTTLIILKEEVAGPEHTTGDTSYNYITTTITSAVKKTSSEKKTSKAETPSTGDSGVETIAAVLALAAAAAYVSHRKYGGN